MTDHVQHMKGSGLTTKVKALLWEECRTGGAITGVCVSVGLLMLLWFRFWGGPLMTTHDPYFTFLTILGLPVAVTLLLILNPDYSGHLVGGFSRRVLRLPVPTSAAVAVALAARTVFVFVAASLMIATSQAIITDAPGLHAVFLITLFYLCAQLVDWLRAPISGLSSLIVLGLIGGGLILVSLGGVNAREVVAAMATPWMSPLVLLVFAAVTYGVSVMSVQAARVGWRVGVPEIWEWPNRLSINWPGRLKPFVSPIGAQVWFELRRTVWSLPRTTLLIWLVLLGMSWIIWERLGNRGGMTQFRITASFLLFVALLLAAVMQGARTRILGFRPSMGKPGYEYLQPLTDAQFAWARILANCAALVPTLLLAVVLHFVLGGWTYFALLVQNTLEIGVVSPREAVWTLVSRGLLAGVLAWALLAIGTRVFRRSFVLLWIAGVIILCLFDGIVRSRYGWGIVAMGIVLYLIGLTIASYVHAWRQGLTPGRTVVAWTGVWALFAWLMHRAFSSSWPADGLSFLTLLGDLLAAMGVASLVPLVYISVLLDIRRRRHSATTPQDPAQHEQDPSTQSVGRPFVTVGAGCVVLFVVWLGWPARPAYEALWKSKGYPMTPAEFDAWYPYVADEENVALKYIQIKERNDILSRSFYSDQAKLSETNRLPQGIARILEGLLVVGSAELSRAEPIPEPVWNATEAYWNGITAQVAPDLKALATNGPHESRYPIDMKRVPVVQLEHLAKLRGLARELHVDALHWTIAGDSRAATDSILSILPVADSLSNEPLLISQLVRIAIIGIAQQALETILNRADLAEDDLVRLQEAFATALPTPDDQMILDRALIGEGSNALAGIHRYDTLPNELNLPLFRLMGLLAYPPEAERMAMASGLLQTQELGRKSWPIFGEVIDQWDDVWREALFITPQSTIITPGMARTYESEWRARTQLNLARTALAVERYRLANGSLPTTLEALVPRFVDRVPQDYFSKTGEFLYYRQHDDGEFVVYSVGRDMEDDEGLEMKRRWGDGDITFTVAAPHVRAQPQVEPR